MLHPQEEVEEKEEDEGAKAHKIAFRSKFLIPGVDLRFSSSGVPSWLKNCDLDTHSPSKPSQCQQGPKTSYAAFNFKFLSGLLRPWSRGAGTRTIFYPRVVTLPMKKLQ